MAIERHFFDGYPFNLEYVQTFIRLQRFHTDGTRKLSQPLSEGMIPEY